MKIFGPVDRGVGPAEAVDYTFNPPFFPVDEFPYFSFAGSPQIFPLVTDIPTFFSSRFFFSYFIG